MVKGIDYATIARGRIVSKELLAKWDMVDDLHPGGSLVFCGEFCRVYLDSDLKSDGQVRELYRQEYVLDELKGFPAEDQIAFFRMINAVLDVKESSSWMERDFEPRDEWVVQVKIFVTNYT
jgi:hypothetical protein